MIAFLHGFTGAPDVWEGPGVALPVAGHHPELLGPITWDTEIRRLHAVLAPLAPVHLVGYSMGARLALGLLAHDPTPFARATLISVNPGLADESQRRARVADDERWARLIETQGLPAFVDAWEAQPLFASQASVPAERRRRAHERRLRHDPAGLTAALRGLGLGVMPDLWPSLTTLPVPVTFVAGERDAKFAALAARAVAQAPRAALRVVPGAGHDLCLECPKELP